MPDLPIGNGITSQDFADRCGGDFMFRLVVTLRNNDMFFATVFVEQLNHPLAIGFIFNPQVCSKQCVARTVRELHRLSTVLKQQLGTFIFVAADGGIKCASEWSGVLRHVRVGLVLKQQLQHLKVPNGGIQRAAQMARHMVDQRFVFSQHLFDLFQITTADRCMEIDFGAQLQQPVSSRYNVRPIIQSADQLLFAVGPHLHLMRHGMRAVAATGISTSFNQQINHRDLPRECCPMQRRVAVFVGNVYSLSIFVE